MDYRRFRANGWFIGSGIVEAGCKHVVGERLKHIGDSARIGPSAVVRQRAPIAYSPSYAH
jgi:hypothetical protein